MLQRTQRRDFGNRDNKWESNKKRKGEFLERENMSNAAFEEYYREQGIVPPGEFGAFLDALRKPLPITFRINGSGKFANELRDKLQSDFFANFASMEVRHAPEIPPARDSTATSIRSYHGPAMLRACMLVLVPRIVCRLCLDQPYASTCFRFGAFPQQHQHQHLTSQAATLASSLPTPPHLTPHCLPAAPRWTARTR